MNCQEPLIYSTKMEFKNFLFIIITCSYLSSCTTGLSVATSGAQAVYNRHTLKKTIDDHYITMQANRKIYCDTDKYNNTNISFSTFNKKVLLTGEIPTLSERKEVEEIVKNIEGVERVYNLTTLSPPSSTLSRMSDTWITAKVKAKLIASNDVDPSNIKVITENGTVYMMGVVPPEEADAAVEIARRIDGVQNVVKVFYYLRISKA